MQSEANKSDHFCSLPFTQTIILIDKTLFNVERRQNFFFLNVVDLKVTNYFTKCIIYVLGFSWRVSYNIMHNTNNSLMSLQVFIFINCSAIRSMNCLMILYRSQEKSLYMGIILFIEGSLAPEQMSLQRRLTKYLI